MKFNGIQDTGLNKKLVQSCSNFRK